MRHTRLLVGIISSIFFASEAISASPFLSLSLAEAIRLAQERPVEVVVADERVRQALSRLTQARAAFFPQVTGTTSMVRQTKNLEAFGISIPGRDPLVGPFNTFDARISVTQTLFDASAIERLRAVEAGRDVSSAEYRKAVQDGMALVAALYLDAERAHEQVALAQALLRREEKRRGIAQSRKEVGAGTSYEVAQAGSDLAEARHRLQAALAEEASCRLDLVAALGLPEDRAIRFDGDKNFKNSPIPSEEEAAMAGREGPEVEIATRLVRQRKIERGVEKADFYPRVYGSADYGASGQSPSNSDGTYSFGGQMTIPIFKGGLRMGRIREAESRVREGEARLTDTQRKGEAKARRARGMVTQAVALLRAAEAERAEASQGLSLAKERRASGLGSDLEVVEAEAGEAAARDRSGEARAAYRLARVNLARAMGHVEELNE